MKLIKVRVQNYRSVEDSEEFEIGGAQRGCMKC
jgi:hypothetical protein